MRWIKPLALATYFFWLLCPPQLAWPQAPRQPVSIAERVAGFERREGLLTAYLDQHKGRLFLEISPGKEFLYLPSLRSGLGSLFPRLDRGMIKMGSLGLVRFERFGGRILLVQLNTKFRALNTDNRDLVRSVEESFARSVLASFAVEAEQGQRILIDATEFFLSDSFGIRAALRETQQGDYKLDIGGSLLDASRTRVFSENLEVDALLTFTSDNPGTIVERNASDARAITFQTHHSLMALPSAGYRPRVFDPRVGSIPLVFNDYAQPYLRPLEQRWITRWRLEKADPKLPLSPPKKPILYYLDPAIPEPLRSAVREGALWWNAAFEDAGFKNAIEVRDLPPDADTLDVRHSIISWVHRSEEGFANGPFVTDPRTGEILKAMPRLHSDRTRVDATFWSGLLNAAAHEPTDCHVADWGLGSWLPMFDSAASQENFFLARVRQLVAHEVGHTLGLEHNFAGSARDRSSVMDYPAPLLRIVNGRLDLSSAYRVGVGEYDRMAVRYAYSVFPSETEAASLREIVRQALAKNLLFISSRDSALHPLATAYDNGDDPLKALPEALAIREFLMKTFDAKVLKSGEPVALLRERFLPVYLYHRFALEAAVKQVGGIQFTYAIKEDGTIPVQPVEPDRQRAAADLLLTALRPDALEIPARLLPLLPPRPYGFGPSANPFDELSLTRALSGLIVKGLLDRERAARVVAASGLATRPFTVDELIGKVMQETWMAPTASGARSAIIQRAVQRVVLETLIELATHEQTTPEVRAAAEWHLSKLHTVASTQKSQDPATQAHWKLAERDIENMLKRECRCKPPTSVPALPPANLTGW